jgi:E1A/CREB-binding protein
MKEQLPGGRFFEPTEELIDQTKAVIPRNKIPERVFGILDFFLRYRPNASTISSEAFLMFVFNKTSE